MGTQDTCDYILKLKTPSHLKQKDRVADHLFAFPRLMIRDFIGFAS